MKNQDNPSEYLLACLHTGELPEEERQRVQQELEQSPSAVAHLEERSKLLEELQDNDRFLEMLAQGEELLLATKEEEAAPEVKARPASHEAVSSWWLHLTQWWQWGGLSAGVAAVAVLLLWHPAELLNPTFQPLSSEHLQVGTTKGGSQSGVWRIIYWRKSSRVSQFLKKNQDLAPGDHIQFSYTMTHKEAHFAVVSVNAKGEISAYAPLQGDKSIQIQDAKGSWPQASSLILDDTLGYEQLIFAMAKQPFSIKALKESVQKAFVRAKRNVLKLTAPKGPWNTQRTLILKTKAAPKSHTP